jgi:hypothetical protein
MSGNPFQSTDAWEVQTERLLPDGNHVVTIQSAEDGTSSGQHPQIELEVSNSQGRLRDWLVITDASIGKVVALAQAASVELPSDEDILDGLRLKQSWMDKLVGKKVGIVARDEPDYKDPTKTRTRIQGYVAPERIKASDVPPNGETDFIHAPAKAKADIPF